jgi:NitT/TauT family transport system permease protein
MEKPKGRVHKDAKLISLMKERIYQVIVLLLILAIWEVGSLFVPGVILSPPSKVFLSLAGIVTGSSDWQLQEHLLTTLTEVVLAFALASSTGVLVGFLLGLSRLLRESYEPVLSAVYAIPSVVWYPPLMLFLGLDEASKIAFGYLLAFFPITLTTIRAVSQVDRSLVRLAKSLGASKLTVLRKIVIPSSVNMVISGLRVGLALSVTGVIVGEMLGSKRGLGFLINSAYTLFRIDDYLAFTVLVIIIALLIDKLGSILEVKFRRP